VPIRQEAGWAPEPRSSEGKSSLYPRQGSSAQLVTTLRELLAYMH